MKSMKTILALVQCFAPAAKIATANGASVNVTGYEAVTVEVNAGTVTDGTFTFKIQESNDGTTFTDAPATSVLGSFPTLTTGANNGSNSVSLVDYVGACAYIRVVMTVAGATTGAVLSIVAILGGARHNPAGVVQVP